ncbi:hypothetical protein [Rhodococcus sp. NPDC060176]|uniref:hypothetical protein n=1 Tax=Rhodococcus sp. NPDC060176 TaxID=3347062 RepID=UPI003659E9EF
MTKNGTYNSSTNDTWLTVPAWTADAGSTVSGNGVVANGSKSNAVVSGQLSINNSGIFSFPGSVRLLVDAAVVKTLTGVNLAVGANLVPIVADVSPVAAGQIVTIQYSIASYAGYATIASGVNTYVRIT